MKIRDWEKKKKKISGQKLFSKVNTLNINKILKLLYEIKVNLIKEDLSRARKNKAKTKAEGNVKGLFIMTPDMPLFNGLEFIKNIKSKWKLAHRYHENVFLEKKHNVES